MRFPLTLALLFTVLSSPVAFALDCAIWEDIYNGAPNTEDQFVVLGRADDNYMFHGVILGPKSPDQALSLQLTNDGVPVIDPVWGVGSVLETNVEFVGLVSRGSDGQYFIGGGLCPLAVKYRPDSKEVERIRMCMRRGRC